MPDYPTNCFDNLRTGWNPQEIVLTPNAIRQNGLAVLGTCAVNGQVYAQPLVVQKLARPNGEVTDFLIVATEENWIYAFDTILLDNVWSRQLLPSGERVVTPTDVTVGKDFCGNISPSIGITSTPAIDVERRLMYVCAKSTDGKGHFYHRLYTINVHNGKDWKPPVEISAKATFGRFSVPFNAQWQLQRPGLLLMNGIVYIGFGAHCDNHAGTYRGWVLAYDATTLNQVGAFSSTLSSDSSDGSGGIWQSGRGLAGDGQFVYCQTGNGNFGPDSYGTQIDYSDTVLKLSAPVSGGGVVDFFTPCDQDLMKSGDADLGSGGPMLFPDQPVGFPHLAITAGKEGTIYLLNRDAMSGFTPPPSGWSPCDGSGNPNPCANSSAVLKTLWMELGSQVRCGWTDSNGNGHNASERDALFGGPALYVPTDGLPTIYFSGQDEGIKPFQYNPALGSLVALGQAGDPIPNGSIPVVSSNGGTTGVLWAASRGGPNGSRQLFVYDLDPSLSLADPKALLATMSNVVPYSPEADPTSPDPAGSSLGPPATVANGLVFVGGLNQVTVIGLGQGSQSGGGGTGGGGCFIAEASVGTDSSAVSTLRTFRDTFLIEHRLGKRFISLYERFSPSFARVIEKTKPLRTLARTLIVWPALLVAKAFLARSKEKRAQKSGVQTKRDRS